MKLIQSLWRGDVPLWKTYWLYSFLVTIGANSLVIFWQKNALKLFLVLGDRSDLIRIAILCSLIIYSYFICIAIWRSAAKYTGPKANAWLARIVVIFGILQTSMLVVEELSSQVTPTSLQQEAELANLGVPVFVDEMTRLDRVSADGMSLTYYYTVFDPEENSIDDFNDFQKELFLDEILVSTMPDQCRDLENYFRSGVVITWSYSAVNDIPIGQNQLQQENCLDMLNLPISSGRELNTTEIASLASEAFATITVDDGNSNESFGSGFVIRSDGVLVTNLHIVENAENIVVQLSSGETYESVSVIGADELRDLLILQIPATGLDTLNLANDETVQLGEDIYVLGNPLGYGQTFSDGVISARRFLDGASSEMFQISAPISPGSSGGPVLNRRGEVIGVATSVVPDGQNLNFAVPIRYVYGIIAKNTELVTFSDFISDADFSNVTDNTADTIFRTEKSNALREKAAPELIDLLSELPPWQQQVWLRLLDEDSPPSAPSNFNPYGDAFGWEPLPSSQSHTTDISLEAGEYFALGECDDDCTDFDIAIYDENLELLVSDTLPDASPIINFKVKDAAQHSIEATMYTCVTTLCGYAIQLYKNP